MTLDTSGMVDLHCHYLPAVDDGASDLRDALALVFAAESNGISRVVLTPHIHPERYGNTAGSLEIPFNTFRTEVENAGSRVSLALSAEVRFSDELFHQLEREEIPFLIDVNGNRSLLLELPHSHVPPGWQQLVRWLHSRGITPIIAHPERNRELMRYPERVASMVKQDLLVQITAGSVIGSFGPRARSAAEYFLKQGWVSVIATDAHNLRARPPVLKEGGVAAAKLVGDSAAWDLVSRNPGGIAGGMFHSQSRPDQDLQDLVEDSYRRKMPARI